MRRWSTCAGAAARARVLLLAVKPQDVDVLLGLLAAHVDGDHLVVSVAAGVTTARIEAALAPGVPVVRVMPNTPALVEEGMSVLSAGAHAGEAHLDEAEELLAAVGRVRRVPEAQQDAVTALSGSGPAYFFYLVEAMVDAGVPLGLPRELAADLIVQTALGAAVMLRDSGERPGAAAGGGQQPGRDDGRRDRRARPARRAGGAWPRPWRPRTPARWSWAPRQLRPAGPVSTGAR